MAKYAAWCSGGACAALFAALMVISFTTTTAAPMESEEEVSGNGLGQHLETELGSPWDGLDADTLRKILLQMEADERMTYAPRSVRAWAPLQRGWTGGRGLDTRAVRQWRADKRQVRFRQCYFNPISCFRK